MNLELPTNSELTTRWRWILLYTDLSERDRVQGGKYSALGSLGATLWNKYELKVAQ